MKFIKNNEQVTSAGVEYDSDNNLVLLINGIEVGYFDEDGLNLFSACSTGILFDDRGYFKVRGLDVYGRQVSLDTDIHESLHSELQQCQRELRICEAAAAQRAELLATLRDDNDKLRKELKELSREA